MTSDELRRVLARALRAGSAWCPERAEDVAQETVLDMLERVRRQPDVHPYARAGFIARSMRQHRAATGINVRNGVRLPEGLPLDHEPIDPADDQHTEVWRARLMDRALADLRDEGLEPTLLAMLAGVKAEDGADAERIGYYNRVRRVRALLRSDTELEQLLREGPP
jgi:DNA-directed RNA polymerase specialized sigma24 family protein